MICIVSLRFSSTLKSHVLSSGLLVIAIQHRSFGPAPGPNLDTRENGATRPRQRGWPHVILNGSLAFISYQLPKDSQVSSYWYR